MAKMWAGRTAGALSKEADDFNSSIHFDSRMYRQDIMGSMEHATMLSICGILSEGESVAIIDGLQTILDDIESGTLEIDPEAEDIHMFVEAELTSRIGEVGKKLHTSRSRNDQVALDIRLYLRDEIDEIKKLVLDLIAAVCASTLPMAILANTPYWATWVRHVSTVSFSTAKNRRTLFSYNLSAISATALATSGSPTPRAPSPTLPITNWAATRRERTG